MEDGTVGATSAYMYCMQPCLIYILSELGYDLFSQAASETYTEDQHTLELEGLEDSGHLVLYKSMLFKAPVALQ